MPELPLVSLSGDAVERGRQHGEALADRIADNITMYTDRMRHDAGLSEDEITHRAGRYLEVFTRYDPQYRSVMAGIARGSGQSLRDIAMLNARFELLYSAWSELAQATGECTAFGAAGDVTTDGEVWIGQNWDWFPAVRGALLTWHDTASDTRVLGYTEAGIAGVKLGLNSAGIGLCVNGLGSTADDWRHEGLPFHSRTNKILTATSLVAATASAALDRPSCSANFVLGAVGAGVADVESSPVGSRCITPEDGEVLVHANHFDDPAALGVTETFRSQPVTTYARQQRLTDLLNKPDTLDVDTMKAALRDHDGDALAVCRHPSNELPEHMRIHTALAVLLDLRGGKLHYTQGPPCQSQFRTVTLPRPTP